MTGAMPRAPRLDKVARGKAWSQADLDTLKKLFDQKLFASVIAERMGRTKGQVSGQLHRLGLKSGPRRAAPARVSSNRPVPLGAGPLASVPGSQPSGSKARGPKGFVGVSSLSSTPMPPSSPPLNGIGVLFGEAKRGQCAYPLWHDSDAPAPDTAGLAGGGRSGRQRYVCGQPVSRDPATGAARPYCAPCAARCYTGRTQKLQPLGDARALSVEGGA